VHDPSHVISYKPLQIHENLSYEEVPIQILDHKEQQLRTKDNFPCKSAMAESWRRGSFMGIGARNEK
jgi:hypothetical protein